MTVCRNADVEREFDVDDMHGHGGWTSRPWTRWDAGELLAHIVESQRRPAVATHAPRINLHLEHPYAVGDREPVSILAPIPWRRPQ